MECENHRSHGEKIHIGTKNLLERLWPILGTSFDWSLAVHPYDAGDPTESLKDWKTFADLDDIWRFQRDRLGNKPGLQPQEVLFASEQGWPIDSYGYSQAARNICRAHEISLQAPYVIGVTHNYFQAVPSSGLQNGQQFGLVPSEAGADLSFAAASETWRAYQSTSSSIWQVRDDHYCCSQHQLGCFSQ